MNSKLSEPQIFWHRIWCFIAHGEIGNSINKDETRESLRVDAYKWLYIVEEESFHESQSIFIGIPGMGIYWTQQLIHILYSHQQRWRLINVQKVVRYSVPCRFIISMKWKSFVLCNGMIINGRYQLYQRARTFNEIHSRKHEYMTQSIVSLSIGNSAMFE